METNYIKQLWQAAWKRKANIICLLIAVTVYCLNQILFKNHFAGIIGCFCQCYLNDLICPLFFLSYSQIFLIWAKHEIKAYKKLVVFGMVAGFIWEYFAPIINPKAITDIYDLICYFCGIQIYYFATLAEKKIRNT